MLNALLVFVQWTGISQHLLIHRNSHNVCDKGNVHIHIASKHWHSWHLSLQRSVRHTGHDMIGNGNKIIGWCFQFLHTVHHSVMWNSSWDLTNDLVGWFNNCIGSGSVRRNMTLLNSPIHHHEFPFMLWEPQTIVSNHVLWEWASVQPHVLESLSILGWLGWSDTGDFNQIGHQINNCHSANLHLETVALEFPWTNEINMGFEPRDTRGILRGKSTALRHRLLHFCTCSTGTQLLTNFIVQTSMPEMALQRSFELNHAFSMSCKWMTEQHNAGHLW